MAVDRCQANVAEDRLSRFGNEYVKLFNVSSESLDLQYEDWRRTGVIFP